MEKEKSHPATIDEYIAQYPADVQAILSEIRAVIRAAAPQAVEKISYQMPAFFQDGGLVWFAANKGYIGFYPTPSGIEAFKDELAPYKGTKSAAHFPLNKPMPYDLIRKIVQFRMSEMRSKRS
jgi:uncharacterized protein YdhG (YjbR/CyaY superfamily)